MSTIYNEGAWFLIGTTKGARHIYVRGPFVQPKEHDLQWRCRVHWYNQRSTSYICAWFTGNTKEARTTMIVRGAHALVLPKKADSPWMCVVLRCYQRSTSFVCALSFGITEGAGNASEKDRPGGYFALPPVKLWGLIRIWFYLDCNWLHF